MEAYTAHDRIAIYLSGGATNQKASASLGGLISSRAVRGMSAQYVVPVPGVVIEDATPENGPGIGTVAITGDTAVYTPPGGGAGTGVIVPSGTRKVLTGADVAKAVRLYRPSGAAFFGTATFRLLDAMNSVLAMGNVADAVRDAGGIHYRAFFLKALGDASGIKLWITTDGQADWALASEIPVSGAIQTVADATTAPSGVSWVDAISQGTALSVGTLIEGETRGIWIRRTFPSGGDVALKETVSLHLQHAGV